MSAQRSNPMRPGGAPGQTPPLLDLLGASWSLDIPITSAAWTGALAAFALGDGTLAMARAEWPGAPSLSPREGGGLELAPATSPRPPMARQAVHGGPCLALAATPEGGFLTGGDDGVLAITNADGETTKIATYPGQWVDLVATSAAGWQACATGRTVHVSGPGTAEIKLAGSITALAFDRSGTQLAIACYHEVTIWDSAGGTPRVLSTPGCPRSIAWSPDGAYLICGLQENALHGWRLSDGGDIEMGGYPGQPRSLEFFADGSFLATSGAPRVICWRFDPPGPAGQPLECGIPSSRMPVCRIACHPHYPMVAAGYHNGAVLLCQPGHDDVLFAKGSSGGSVSALAWSADGSRLAVGTEGGEAGVVALPPSLFRFAATSRRPTVQ